MEVIIMRGLSGAGKSTRAKEIAHRHSHPRRMEQPRLSVAICSADDYFIEGGEYNFDPSKLKQAHAACFEKFKVALEKRTEVIIVDNTNTQKWEFVPYIKAAMEKTWPGVSRSSYRIYVETVRTDLSAAELAERNVHGVPEFAIQRQMDRWERYVPGEATYAPGTEEEEEKEEVYSLAELCTCGCYDCDHYS